MFPRLGSILATLGLVAVVVTRPASADDIKFLNPSNLGGVELHGLVSQGAFASTANNYLAFSHQVSPDFTEVGLNATKQFGDSFRIGMQLFTSKLGPKGTYVPTFDWFYLDWHRFDWLGLRAGRVKTPYGLYNEVTDYDPGFLPVLMPQSVYPITSRDFLLSTAGLELYGYKEMGHGGALSYSVVGGASFLTTSTTLPPGATLAVPFTWAARVIWETPLTGLRAAVSAIGTRFDFNLSIPDPTQGGALVHIAGRLPAYLWVGSIEYARGRFRFSGEYSNWLIQITTSRPGLIPNMALLQERSYLAGEYSIIDPVAVGVYYAPYFPLVVLRTGNQKNYQHDLALSVRWDITSHWLVKFEGHFMHGTADLDPSINGNVPLTNLTMNWGFFAAKVSAYF